MRKMGETPTFHSLIFPIFLPKTFPSIPFVEFDIQVSGGKMKRGEGGARYLQVSTKPGPSWAPMSIFPT